MNEDMRNMFLAIAISLALVFGVQTFLPQLFPSMQTQPEQQQTDVGSGGSGGGLTVTGSDGQVVASVTTRDDALANKIEELILTRAREMRAASVAESTE